MPAKMDRSLLRGWERLSVPALEYFNGSPRLKRGVHGVIGQFNARWITWTTGVSWQIHGFERIERLTAPRGVILVANHLSFFDMYIASALLVTRTELMQQLCFPVRKNYHYDSPTGPLLNIGMSAGAMWPPVFREAERRTLNHVGLQQMAEFLNRRGAAIGIHPEGTRNRGRDPYASLPFKPGLGRLVQVCDPEVVILPYFIIGLGNNFAWEVGRRFRPEGRRGPTIRVRFAEPIKAGEVRKGRDDMGIVEAVMATVQAEGQLDREVWGPLGGLDWLESDANDTHFQ